MDLQKIKSGQQTLDSDYSEFSVTDPFNPQNHVEGQISFSRDRRYGALQIKRINGEPVNQPSILGTPKIAYPFGLGHNYRFPSAERIYRFRKYDGTNIFMYRYTYNGLKYITLTGRIAQMFNIAKNEADTRKKIWELIIMHGFDGNTNTATVFHKIASQLDQDKRLVYKTIKNVQKMIQMDDE